jgi:hypothetical protein
MLPEIDALIAKPDLLVALLVGALFGIAIARLSSRGRRSTWRPRNRWPHSSSNDAEARRADVADQRAADAADQLRIVMRAEFASRPLLNKGEARVFRELDRAVMARNATWQVMAQVSLGEILRSRDSEAFRCINSKRVDLLLVDADCMPRYAIEYQGEGHHQSAAAARDAVKKEALRRAGIGYYEVVAGQTTPAELRRLVEKLIGDQPPPSA